MSDETAPVPPADPHRPAPDPAAADDAPAMTEAGQDRPPSPPGPTYPGAPDSLISAWMKRRSPMALGRGEGLPPPDIDLKALLQMPVSDPGPLPGRRLSIQAQKLHEMRSELVGKPELAVLNAILIAHLRKTDFPAHAPTLFHRIWTEQGAALMPQLPGRWLISTVITFGDHGETEAQRRVGLSINVLFSLMKLYEFERLHSGFAPDRPFPVRRTKGRQLPVGMPSFALVGGGLDINLLAQIWNEARSVPVVGPLACHLLDRLNDDPGTLFRRIGLMRVTKKARRAARRATQAPAVPTEP